MIDEGMNKEVWNETWMDEIIVLINIWKLWMPYQNGFSSKKDER
jgi:hypothetical protein